MWSDGINYKIKCIGNVQTLYLFEKTMCHIVIAMTAQKSFIKIETILKVV